MTTCKGNGMKLKRLRDNIFCLAYLPVFLCIGVVLLLLSGELI